MKAEFVLLGLMFTVEVFPNLKSKAFHEQKEQLMHSFKPGDCKYFCCEAKWIVLWHEGKYKSKIVYLLHGGNIGYSMYKKKSGKYLACSTLIMRLQHFQITWQDSK